MKLPRTVIILTLVTGIISCQHTKDDLKDDEVFQASFDNCKTSIDLKLSDLIEDARLVQLETTQESLIDDLPRFIISDNYIVVIDRDGVYKFSANGKFIRKLINVGWGPQEFISAYNYSFYEKKNLLVIVDRYPNNDLFQIYDIAEEHFLNPVKKCFVLNPFTRESFTVYNDSLIMWSISSISYDTIRYALMLQNFQGEFITGIANSRKIFDPVQKEERIQRLDIRTGGQDILVHYTYDDTIFRYKDNHLLPYVIVEYNTPRDYVRTTAMEIGESRVGFPLIDNPGYMILRESIFQGNTEREAGRTANYITNNYFLNKSDGSFALITSYTDDITGQKHERSGKSISAFARETLNLPEVLPGGRIYVLYQPFQLTGKDLTDNPDLPANLQKHLREIQKNLNEMDNPVLLIGKMKKTI